MDVVTLRQRKGGFGEWCGEKVVGESCGRGRDGGRGGGNSEREKKGDAERGGKEGGTFGQPCNSAVDVS